MYFDEREFRKRRRRRIVFFVVSIIVFFSCAGGGAYALLYSDVFDVRDFRVSAEEGYGVPSAASLRADLFTIVSRQSLFHTFLARFAPDAIFLWPTKDITVPESYPSLQRLSLTTDVLHRSVALTVVPRARYGIVCEATSTPVLARSACAWFDQTGFLFSEAPETRGGLIVRIDDITGRALRVGSFLFPHELFTTTAMGIFKSIQESGLDIRTFELRNLDDQEIIAVSDTLPPMFFSLRADPAFILPGLRTLMGVGFQTMEYVDFRVPNRVFYKPR